VVGTRLDGPSPRRGERGRNGSSPDVRRAPNWDWDASGLTLFPLPLPLVGRTLCARRRDVITREMLSSQRDEPARPPLHAHTGRIWEAQLWRSFPLEGEVRVPPRRRGRGGKSDELEKPPSHLVTAGPNGNGRKGGEPKFPGVLLSFDSTPEGRVGERGPCRERKGAEESLKTHTRTQEAAETATAAPPGTLPTLAERGWNVFHPRPRLRRENLFLPSGHRQMGEGHGARLERLSSPPENPRSKRK